MSKDSFDNLLESLDKGFQAGARQAEPHIQGFIKASQDLIADLKAQEHKFRDIQQRVERKLKSGVRRTQGDPV